MAVTITAAQTITLVTDVDGDGVVDPGDTVQFQVTIQNTADPAIGVSFAENLDGMTLVAGTLNVSPIARNDSSYSVAGNVELTVNAGSGVLGNDSDPGQTIGVDTTITGFSATSANGGTVALAGDGSFTYQSATGFTGNDTFTYTLTDSFGATNTATVTIDVGPSVWFIDNSIGGGPGDGSQDNPFRTIAEFNAANAIGGPTQPKINDVIYLRQGTGTYSEADGINLKNGQQLFGQGEDLVVDGVTIETAGLTPTIVVTGGTNNGIDLAQNNIVKGLDIGNTTGADIADGGGTVGTLTIENVSLSGTGQAVDIDQGGVVDVTLESVTVTSTAGDGIHLAGVSGSFTAAAGSLAGAGGTEFRVGDGTGNSGGTAAISFGGTITNSSGGGAVRIEDRAAGAGDITLSGKIDHTAAGQGGIVLDDNVAAPSRSPPRRACSTAAAP